MSETILLYFLETLLRGALLWGLLLLLECIFRRKLLFAHARWFYWLLLLLVLAPGNLFPEPRLTTTLPTLLRLETFAGGSEEYSNTPPPVQASAPAKIATGNILTVVPASTGWQPGWADWVLFFYLGMVSLLSAKQLRQFIQWRRRILACPAVTQGRVFDVFRESAALVGLSETPPTLRDAAPLLPSPACFGFGRDRAVLCRLPDMEKHTDAELRMLMIHELGHLVNFDNPAACLSVTVINLWRFNPFVALILKRAAFAGELKCDRLVRRSLRLQGSELGVYAQLLVNYQLRAARVMVCSPLGGCADNLKLRIQEFSMKKNRIQWSILCGMAVTLSIAAVVFPMLLHAETAAQAPVAPEVKNGNPLLSDLNRALENMRQISYTSVLHRGMKNDGMERLESFYQLVDPADGFVYRRRDFGRQAPGEAVVIDQTNLINREGNYIYSATNAIKRPGSTLNWPPAPINNAAATVTAQYPAAYQGIPCIKYTVTLPAPDSGATEQSNTHTYLVGRDNGFVYAADIKNSNGSILVSQALGEVDFHPDLTQEWFQLPPGIPVTEVGNQDDVRTILFPEQRTGK